jgi:murein DD-endopeptidase MepM/ murein hydrolase activator NlpD
MRRPYTGDYPITRPYGVVDPAYVNYPNSAHPGTDYGTPFRTPLVAAQGGLANTIVRGNTTIGKGNEVRIINGNVEVRYAHMDEIIISNNSTVVEGQVIGYVGWTGYVLPKSIEGSHLHFELLLNGQYTDFEKYFTNEGVIKMATREEVIELHNIAFIKEDKDCPQGTIDYWTKKPIGEFINFVRRSKEHEAVREQYAAGAGLKPPTELKKGIYEVK